MPNSKYRFAILKIIIVVMVCAVIYRLYDLQIIKGEQYAEVAEERLITNVVEKAPRGEIYDRYGEALVTNKVSYDLILQRATQSNAELNHTIKSVLDILDSEGVPVEDSLPISNPPYGYIFEEKQTTTEDWFTNNPHIEKEIQYGMSAKEVMEAYKKIYGISDEYSEELQRRLIGVRYEAETRGFSQVSPFSIVQNIPVSTVAKIKEQGKALRGVSVSNNYVRNFEKPGIATHLIGRTGKINAQEYEEKKSQGYGMNDVIGKEGIEAWAEEFLRGTDGTSGSVKRINNKEVSLVENVEPIGGSSVTLTIDSSLQEQVERILAENIQAIQKSASGKKKGEDCNAGAVAVLDVKTGDTLALASYPTYDMSRFDEDYAMLLENKANPFFNRSVSGLYSPGSTFKPLSAIAAMQSGNLTPYERVQTKGIYKYYQDYQPSCWIWSENHITHGTINVSTAIEQSCNYFFYEVGRRMGIDTLNEYASEFGLGEYTGIELREEAKGAMASPDYKKKVIKNITNQSWFGGDTLQAAIGQSYSLFTPVQLASYAATIANGGVRYKVNLIKNIRSSEDGHIVAEYPPQIVGKVDMSNDVINAVKNGMQRVVDEGSASNIFAGYSIPIGGKTGTAQVGSGSNNALFIAYAPFNNPEIAISVVLEHGVRGTNAAKVAKDVFDVYFNKE